jgi:hypothetical protein
MVAAAERYAGAVARVGREAGSLLAIDLGDEIANVDPAEALALEPEVLAAWYGRLRAAVRAEAPGIPVMQANDVSGVLGPSPFGPDAQGGLDLVGVHGWPLWSPGSIESTASPKASLLPGFLAAAARPFGPPLIDELGSYAADEGIAAGHLRAGALSALVNGATGVLAWCWRDIVSGAAPYDERPAERHAGLCRADGTAKPALAAFREVAGAAAVVAGLAADPARVALYVPERARRSASSYLDPGCGTVAGFVAWLLAKRAHLALDVVAGEIDAAYGLVVCPSARHLTATDLARLHDHAAGGGTVYVSVADPVGGLPDEGLAGVRAVDFTRRPEGRASFAWAGRSWALPWREGERGITVAATTATVEGRYEDGTPAVTANRVGAGLCLLCTAPVEDRLDAPGRLDGSGWEGLYRELARRAGVVSALSCDRPEVELVVGRSAGVPAAVAINHAGQALEVTFRSGTGAPAPPPRSLPAKGWGLVELEA